MTGDFLIENGVLKKYTGTDETVEIPDNVIKIGKEAFLGCQVKSVVFKGNNLKSIDDDAFRACTQLQNIMIPDGVVQIGDRAFMECENLRYIGIPDSVLVVGAAIIDSCHPDIFVIGKENTEASNVADTFNVPLKSNVSETLAAFESANQRKQNNKTQTFDIFGESVTCSNTLALYHHIIEYYSSRKETVFSELYERIPKTLEETEGKGVYGDLLLRERDSTLNRLAKQGVFTTGLALSICTATPLNALVEAFKTINEAFNAVVADANSEHSSNVDRIFAAAESKVVGLNYGVIGDSLSLATHALDEFLAKEKQRKKAYAEARAQAQQAYNATVSKGNRVYSDFLEKAVPHLRNGVNIFLETLCKAEIDLLTSAGLLDSSIPQNIDIQKSVDLLKSVIDKGGDNSFTVALSIKKYPMNIGAYVYAAEHGYTCPGLADLIRFLGIDSKINEIVDDNKMQFLDACADELTEFDNYSRCILYVQNHRTKFTDDEISRLLHPVASRLALSIQEILQISIADELAISAPEEYCDQCLRKLIVPSDWEYFVRYGVNPVENATFIPAEARKDFASLLNWLCAEVKKRIPELEREEQARKKAAAAQKKNQIVVGGLALCAIILAIFACFFWR